MSACTEVESEPQLDTLNRADMKQFSADMRVGDKDLGDEPKDDMGAQGKDSGDDMTASQEDMAVDMAPVEGCGKDHPRVGWTATLTTKAHGVRGTAVIVDNCTVEVRNFSYDGTGLDVRLYGTKGADFRQGWPMSEDLIRRPAYMDETVIGKLPQGRTLDDLDAISVWCVDIPVDFGSASFKVP